jgi:D-alanyl-D-alanine carboxypeptidase/D-alanyl-D-alanine-endopeptidase (penicillin-binding protein 4)
MMRPAQKRVADALEAYIKQPRFGHAQWGLQVVDLDTGKLLFQHNADKLFIPASNTKLYTAALALSVLGPRFRFHTSLFASRVPSANGVLHGSLVLYGRGDPALGQGNNTQPPNDWADRLASALRLRGVRVVHGDIIADDTYYSGPPFGSGWEANDLENSYAPGVSALSVQGNSFTLALGGSGQCCTVRTDPAAVVHVVNTLHAPSGSQATAASDADATGSYDPLGLYRAPGSDRLYVFGSRRPSAVPRIFTLSAPDPARLAGSLLADALTRQGIRLTGRIRVLHWPNAGTPDDGRHLIHISDIRSPPLSDLVGHMLKESDNLYAQLLLMAVGKRTSVSGVCVDQKHPPTLTANWGLCAMRALMRRIGEPNGSLHLEEGSGLSRKDLVTPEATTHLLAWIQRQPFAGIVRKALPEAGMDGTLEYRLQGPLTEGRVQAKTGTLHYAYALSGYVTAANGAHLVFSIMLNNYARPLDTSGMSVAPRPQHDIDALTTIIAGYGTAGNATLPGHAEPAQTVQSVH